MKTVFCFVLLGFLGVSWARYDPDWASLDSRPLPPWYDGAKVGIFISWGLFSVPSFGNEWFWSDWQSSHSAPYVDFMKNNYRPNFTYQDFAPKFTAELYNPEEWVDAINASGAKYIVFISKHHEGFTLWPSKYSWNWNSVDVGPKRDLLGDLAKALRSKAPHVHFGLYHSLFEWFNPLYLQDKENKYTTKDFVTRKTMPELYELVNNYTPDVLWSDGDWEAPDTYWNSTGFLAWLFNDSPVKDTVVVNDRWGHGVTCHHGSFYTCQDRYNPGVLQPHKWENAMTLDKKSWGYRREASVGDYLTIHELLTLLAETISCGGNLLVNIGPSHDGRLPPIMEERLRQLGSWLDINGEAIYDSVPWRYQNDTFTPGVWFTSKGDQVYGLVLTWPQKSVLTLGAVASASNVKLLGYKDQENDNLQVNEGPAGLQVTFPPMSEVSSQWVWVLSMSGVKPA